MRSIFQITLIVAVLSMSGCTSVPEEQRIDNVPRYGQPEISRPDWLKKADQKFIENAAKAFGSREEASRAWAAEAQNYLNKGNLHYAMRRYNQSWLLNPENYEPYWGFGRILLERDQFDESIENFERAKQLIDDPRQEVALLSDAGVAYSYKAYSISNAHTSERKQYFEMANDQFARSTAMDPNYPNSWFRWAVSLYQQENYAEAWVKVKKARSLGAPVDTFTGHLEKKMPEPE